MNDQTPIEKLRFIMRCLRDPQWGCPWDLEQTPRSIAPYTLEEAYEVVDAVHSGDVHHLKEELGDLLLQIVFYSQMAEEQQQFSFDDVVNGISDKLLRRHPHVFPEGQLVLFGQQTSSLHGASEVEQAWEQIKQKEKNNAHSSSTLFNEVGRGQPPLKRASKLQKAARQVGFDWNDVAPAFAKVAEELEELKVAAAQQDAKEAVAEEFGDLLFAAVNVSRYLRVDPELALLAANNKFETRMQAVEQRVLASGKQWSDFTLKELDAFWNQVKRIEKNQTTATQETREP